MSPAHVSIALAAMLAAGGAPACTVAIDPGAGDWEERSFHGHTEYRVERDDGGRLLAARSRASASGRFLERPIDLGATPVLAWRWRARRLPAGGAEDVRAGDDFAARVYVVRRHPVMFWKSLAITYVWSRDAPVGAHWPNPYTDRTHVVVVRSGAVAAVGSWQRERRDVRADFERFFGVTVDTIDGVALMTDSDDTGSEAAADYRRLCFEPA